jgi:hypothetical protein
VKTKTFTSFREVHVTTEATTIYFPETATDLAIRVLNGDGARATKKVGRRETIGPSLQNGPIETTIAEAAAANGMSERAYKRLRTVERKGIPELVQAIKDGKIKVTTAEQYTQLPPDEQREQLELHIEANGRRIAYPDKTTAKQWSRRIFAIFSGRDAASVPGLDGYQSSSPCAGVVKGYEHQVTASIRSYVREKRMGKRIRITPGPPRLDPFRPS